MRCPRDRIIVGLYLCVLGWLGAIAGWLLDAPIVGWPGLAIALWGAVLAWFGIGAELRRRGEHRR